MKVFFYGCILAASSATIAGCHTDESASPAAVQTVQAHVEESRQQDAPLTVRATGTLRARESATISAQVVGRIERVLVREGDSVRAGQTLVVLDDATLRSSVDQAQAAYRAAQSQQAAAQTQAALAASTLARYKQLREPAGNGRSVAASRSRIRGRGGSARAERRSQSAREWRARHAGLHASERTLRRHGDSAHG